MKFGIHLDLSVPRPFETESERRVFDYALEQAIEADRLGFDFCWASEHHFLAGFSHGPAPDLVLGAIAARTSRLRLGLNALAHPVNHPAVTAGRAATLDLLSHGRAELAIARPVAWAELVSFGSEPAADVWDETLRAISTIWATDRASLDGAEFKLQERSIVPRPYQRPHLPLWASACDARDELGAAGLGAGLLTGAIADQRAQAQRVATYKNRAATSEGVASFVNDQVAMMDLLHCHEGDVKGIEAGARLLRTAHDLAGQQASAREFGLKGELARPSGLAIGDPRSIIDSVRSWESMGVDQVVFTLNAAQAVSQTDALQSMRLFAAEVMPAFNRQRTRAAAE